MMTKNNMFRDNINEMQQSVDASDLVQINWINKNRTNWINKTLLINHTNYDCSNLISVNNKTSVFNETNNR